MMNAVKASLAIFIAVILYTYFKGETDWQRAIGIGLITFVLLFLLSKARLLKNGA